MAEYRFPDKNIFLIDPNEPGNLDGLRPYFEKLHLVPPGNVMAFSTHARALEAIGGGETCDIVVIDPKSMGMLAPSPPFSIPEDSAEMQCQELHLEAMLKDAGFAESSPDFLESNCSQFLSIVSRYLESAPGCKGIMPMTDQGGVDALIIKAIAPKVLDFLRIIMAPRGKVIDPRIMLYKIQDTLEHPDFRASKHYKGGSMYERFFTLRKRMPFNEAYEKSVGPHTPKGSALVFDVGYKVRNPWPDDGSDTPHCAAIMFYQDFPTLLCSSFSYANPRKARLRDDVNRERFFSGVIADVDVDGDEQRTTLAWIDEFDAWLMIMLETKDGRNSYTTPPPECLRILMEAYNIPESKVNAAETLHLSPGELERLSKNANHSSAREFILKLLQETGFGEEADSGWFERNIGQIELMPSRYIIQRGNTGLGVLINDKWAIKFDEMPRIGIEHRVYTHTHFGECSWMVPSVKEGGFSTTEDGKYGGLILENVAARKKSGFAEAADIAARHGIKLEGIVDHNLFMMGVFHKCADRDEELKKSLGKVIYEDKRGITHSLACNIPLAGIANESYRRFMETAVRSEEFIGIIDNYNALLSEDFRAGRLSAIHGDWKPENMVNGILVDLAMMGLSKKVDEIAYYISDSRMGADLEGFHRSVNRYIEFRQNHDIDFYVLMQSGGRDYMHQIADSAFLRQLVLRHSVMKKRDMMDDEKYAQRNYYKHRIEEVMREGRFV